MSEYLPPEVLTEIFLRLPSKSIIQCTSVCKPWYSLITSPTFISTHLHHNHDDYLLVRLCSVKEKDTSRLFWDDEHPPKEIYALYCDNENFDHYVQFDAPPFKYYSHFNVVGSCNGLLCLSDDLRGYTDLFHLWNPSIRKSVKLPEPIFVFNTYGPFDHTSGFGYDAVNDDYKVVRIVHTEDYNGQCIVPPHVELYKLSTGLWQDITHVSPPYMFYMRTPGVWVKGSCHWVASPVDQQGPNMIILFDVHKEIFREMMLPDSVAYMYVVLFGERYRLFVSDESVCLSYAPFRNDTIEIWAMKEYGDPESWVKQFNVNLQHVAFNICVVDENIPSVFPWRERQVAHFLRKPIASRKNGEILWRADNGFLVSYDPAAEKVKILGICNANYSGYQDALYVNTYKESLILLGKRVDYCDGSTCEESSNLCKREPKDGKEALEGNITKKTNQEKATKRSRMLKKKKRQVQWPVLKTTLLRRQTKKRQQRGRAC